jgi:UDP-glucuronate 4-epimerase
MSLRYIVSHDMMLHEMTSHLILVPHTVYIGHLHRGMPIQQYGDGSTSRDYTYISDIVDGVVRALDTPLGYEILNLGNGKPFQLSKFIGIVENAVGREAIIEQLPDQPGDVDRTCANIDKAQELLGYKPKVCMYNGYACV